MKMQKSSDMDFASKSFFWHRLQEGQEGQETNQPLGALEEILQFRVPSLD